MSLKSNAFIPLIGRYILVGIILGFPYMFLIYILDNYFKVPLALSVLFSYTVTSFVSFLSHKYYTFKSSNNIYTEFIKYIFTAIVLYCAIYLLDAAFSASEIGFFNLLLIWLCTAILNFISFYFVVFSTKKI